MANLRYPLSPGRGDFIMFVARKYVAGGVEIDPDFGLTTKRLGGEVANICLPIQSSITDSNGVDWKEDRLDPLRAGAADIAIGAVEGEEGQKQTVCQEPEQSFHQIGSFPVPIPTVLQHQRAMVCFSRSNPHSHAREHLRLDQKR